MKMITHCPYSQSDLIQQALTPDKMRIAFLLGAGCPVSIKSEVEGGWESLIPDISGLTQRVEEELDTSSYSQPYKIIKERLNKSGGRNPNIEEVLTHIRALKDVVHDGDIAGLNQGLLTELDAQICDRITNIVNKSLPQEGTPYHHLAIWIRGIQRVHAIEIFTPNYDLLIEQAMEQQKVPYFDGFVGSKNAFFDLTSMENDVLPLRWARLWKIHGSINWWRSSDGDVVRGDYSLMEDDVEQQMIYPSHWKYDQSRRLPYLAMLDRLRNFLSSGQAVLITNGYSFSDQHLNEVILHGLKSNATAVCFALLYGNRADYPEALNHARLHPNFSVMAADGAVLGTREGDWKYTKKNLQMQNISVEEILKNEDGVEEETSKFLLGDFKCFGNFLATQLATKQEDN